MTGVSATFISNNLRERLYQADGHHCYLLAGQSQYSLLLRRLVYAREYLTPKITQRIAGTVLQLRVLNLI